MKRSILIFGYGYVAQYLSLELLKFGWDVYCTSRSLRCVSNQNLKIIDFKLENIIPVLNSVEMILSTVPPNDNDIDPVLKIISKKIISLKDNYLWLGYLSSTSVYGDHKGEWVNELTICNANSPKIEKRLFAEKSWINLYSQYNLPTHIFRLAGIYGPANNCLERIKKGKNFTTIKKGHYFSRIHVLDISHILIRSMLNPTPGEIYNVSDDEPAPLNVVDQYGAELLSMPQLLEIPFEKTHLSNAMNLFFSANKRISNEKICRALNIKLIYPNYRIGLSKGCLYYSP